MYSSPRTIPTFDATHELSSQVPLTVHIIATTWHNDYIQRAVKGAIEGLKAVGGNGAVGISLTHFNYALKSPATTEAQEAQVPLQVELHRVSGSWELMARIASLVHSRTRDLDRVCYVALGAVVRGETSHYDHLCDSVFVGLSDLVTSKNAVIGMGVITCENIQQLEDRCDTKGQEAMESAFVEMWRRVGGRATFAS